MAYTGDPSEDPFKSIGGGKFVNGGWVPTGHPAAQQAAPGPIAPIAPGSSTNAVPGPQTAQQTLTTPTPVGGTATQGDPGTVAGAFQQALLNRMAPAPISAQSPEIAPAIQANQLAEQRGLERQRNLLAEQSATEGTNMSGGFDSRALGLEQDRAAREGQYAGGLVNALSQQRSGESTSAQNLAGSLLGQQDSLAQQKQLADLDAQLRREGLGVQSTLGQGDLALREQLGLGNLNLGLASLLQGGQQFNSGLASQNAQFGANLNQNALLSLLGYL